MNNLDTINRGNHIVSFEFIDTDDYWEEDYDPIDIEEEEINYEENL
jgi:hypothetical protein